MATYQLETFRLGVRTEPELRLGSPFLPLPPDSFDWLLMNQGSTSVQPPWTVLFNPIVGLLNHSPLPFPEQTPHDKRKNLVLARRRAFVAGAPLPLLPLGFPCCGPPGLAPAAPHS
jgi:hypothetical protein